MVDVNEMVETLKGGFDEPQALVLSHAIVQAVNPIERDMVRKEDFRELTGIVRALAEAQRRTEEEVKLLAEAQRRTEERLEALTERVDSLAEAQWQTEEQVKLLAETQVRMERRLGRLEERMDETNRMLGGLSDTVGYRLEDEAMMALPLLLKQDFDVVVNGKLVRKFVRYPNGRMDEVNIFGEGWRGEKLISIVGQAKSQLGKKHLDDLLKQVKRLQKERFLREEYILVVVTYSADPLVEEYARKLGVKVYWSFELRSSE
jgi:hypothetical protein